MDILKQSKVPKVSVGVRTEFVFKNFFLIFLVGFCLYFICLFLGGYLVFLNLQMKI